MAAFVVVMVSVSLVAGQAQADSKRKRSGTNISVSTLQKNTSAVGDVPGHELTQQITTARTTKSTDPVWVNQVVTNFDQLDENAGTGTHRGYSMGVLNDGSNAPVRYEGNHKTTTKTDGSLEWLGDGKYWLLPGTGKMKNKRGRNI